MLGLKVSTSSGRVMLPGEQWHWFRVLLREASLQTLAECKDHVKGRHKYWTLFGVLGCLGLGIRIEA